MLLCDFIGGSMLLVIGLFLLWILELGGVYRHKTREHSESGNE